MIDIHCVHGQPMFSGCRLCGTAFTPPTGRPEADHTDVKEPCKHENGTWFDRSIGYDGNGEELGMVDRCNDCGANMDDVKEPGSEEKAFVPLAQETAEHDMKNGPCKCGAWHEDKADRMFPRERYYGSWWDGARQKIDQALAEAYQRGKEEWHGQFMAEAQINNDLDLKLAETKAQLKQAKEDLLYLGSQVEFYAGAAACLCIVGLPQPNCPRCRLIQRVLDQRGRLLEQKREGGKT